jgi:hypothetical protein
MSPDLMFWFALTTKMAITALFVSVATIIAERLGAAVGACGDAAGLSWACLRVFGARSGCDFYFCERRREPRNERRHCGFCNGLCTDGSTTLAVDQRVSGIYGLAGDHFGARSCSLECPLGIRSQPGCLRPLLVDRQTVLPGTHALDDTALVRLRGKGGHGDTAGRRGRDSKFSNWSDGKRRACCIPGHLHKYYGDLASPRRRSRHGRSASERRSRPCRFWRSAANAASHSSATWISPSPHCRPRCLCCLECLLICDTALRILCLRFIVPIGAIKGHRACLRMALLAHSLIDAPLDGTSRFDPSAN